MGQFHFGVFAHFNTGDDTGALEAEDFVQCPLSVPRAVGRLRQIGRDSKPCVIAGQEVPEHGIGLVYGAGAGETQFGHQPVLKSAGGTFHSAFGLGRAGEDLLDAQLHQGTTEVGGFHRRLDVPRFAGEFEHAVAVAVQGDGQAPALDQSPHQGEVSPGVLLGTEHRVDHGAGGVVNRQQQGELGTVIAQPPVETAVDLHQHPSLGHPLPPHPMLGRTPVAWAGNARPGQNAPHGGPAEVDALPVPEQLGEVGVVGASVGGAGQLDHRGCLIVRNSVAGSAASVPVGQCGGALLAIVRQNSPSMAFTHPQDLGSLGYR